MLAKENGAADVITQREAEWTARHQALMDLYPTIPDIGTAIATSSTSRTPGSLKKNKRRNNRDDHLHYNSTQGT
jgi:hypothetical protein